MSSLPVGWGADGQGSASSAVDEGEGVLVVFAHQPLRLGQIVPDDGADQVPVAVPQPAAQIRGAAQQRHREDPALHPYPVQEVTDVRVTHQAAQLTPEAQVVPDQYVQVTRPGSPFRLFGATPDGHQHGGGHGAQRALGAGAEDALDDQVRASTMAR